MSTSDRYSEGRGVDGYGVHTPIYVSRRSARGSRTVAYLPTDGADASGAGTGGCQQRRRHCENSAATIVDRQQR